MNADRSYVDHTDGVEHQLPKRRFDRTALAGAGKPSQYQQTEARLQAARDRMDELARLHEATQQEAS